MKFLFVVLTIRFLVEMMSNKKNSTNANDKGVGSGKIYHPAEFELR